ncbi:hypothetical protein RJ640_028369 [Escallonia rubra]|uniref:PWWP domain-containing protein n=1 Tax=Escallonia rubra TaxID=112253 RepID=A0AA88U8P7_9ASTE|nr:hypothetical protein RJ640_028369 [Escallonia rubra]
MESSDTGTSDWCEGAIVWVRRRNGSWWPGKILGPEELSDTHLMSPRSGTPVKLLGRDDASVDWYNLDKSKRVKAFRCGEFDDSIERAEASLGMPPKKREKYARREDAILDALELEKQLLEKKYGKLDCSSNGSGSGKKELATSSESKGCGNEKRAQPESRQLSKRLDLSVEDKNKGHHLSAQGVSDDKSDVLPRMRGLQDLGLRAAPSKRKLAPSYALNGSQKPALADSANTPIDGGLTTESVILANSKSLLDNRKLAHEGLGEESLAKRRERRRPLVQVLESSEKLPVPNSLQPDSGKVSLSVSGVEPTGSGCSAKRSRYTYLTERSSNQLEDKKIYPNQLEISPPEFQESAPHPSAMSEDSTSGSAEDTETDSSETDSLESETDEAMTELSDDAAPLVLIPKYAGVSEAQGERGSSSSEESDDLALTSDMSRPCPKDPVSASVGVSKWQLKGKRNSRGLTRRNMDPSSRELSRGSSHGMNLRGEGSYGRHEAKVVEKSSRSQIVGYGSRGFDGVTRDIISWEDLAWNDQPAFKGWEDSGDYFDPVYVGRRHGGRMKSMLVDVDLKVQSSYQREHVPMISLMSKLNGKAIVGHPIQIEVLESGATETLLAAAPDLWPDMVDNDTALPPVWRTARRSANCRVPRPHSLSVDGGETVEHLQHVDRGRKVLNMKSNVGMKGASHISRPQLDRNIFRKPPKKSLSSSPKIRTLSSIATKQKHGSDLRRGGNSYQVDGLIKPELAAPTAVACIPVKLVFSRLYEELVGRHQ